MTKPQAPTTARTGSAQSVESAAYSSLGRPSQLVFELGHNAFDLFFSAPSRIAIFAFEQNDEVISPAVDLIEIIGTEFSPVVVDFISEVLPLCPENVLLHLSSSCLLLAYPFLR